MSPWQTSRYNPWANGVMDKSVVAQNLINTINLEWPLLGAFQMGLPKTWKCA
jgi:hypothetical protein